MTDSKQRLSHAELAMVDALITYAQAKGATTDPSNPTSGAAEAAAARHAGIAQLWTDYQREVASRILELARELDGPSTLAELVDLRGRAISGR